MITEIIRDRIVRASLEVSNSMEFVQRVLRTIGEPNTRHPDIKGGASAPVNPQDLPLSRAMDLLESEIVALQRALAEFRGDEPEESREAPTQLGRYK